MIARRRCLSNQAMKFPSSRLVGVSADSRKAHYGTRFQVFGKLSGVSARGWLIYAV